MPASKIAIIGGGLSGLCCAWYLSRNPEHQLTVYEAAPAVGGKIQTWHSGDFTVESGPNGFLDSRKEILQLAHEIGLSERILPSNSASARRFICSEGQLREIYANPVKFMTSPLLSWPAKFRLALEHFAKPPQGEDETLETFGTRKLGRQAFERLIDPMASGIYAGNPATMSVRSCFPKIYEMERKYGSLTKALFSIKKERRQQGAAGGGPAGPAGVLTSFVGGMKDMTDALQQGSRAEWKTNLPIQKIEKTADGRYCVTHASGQELYDAVVVATPAWDAADIVKQLDHEMAAQLRLILPSPIHVVAVAFNEHEVNADTNGFGFLVPGTEKRKLLGSLWTSAIFKHRAPQGIFMTRCMVGGARQTQLAELDDEALVALVRQELRDIMGIDANPIFTKVFRWQKGIPQYNLGHHQVVSWLEERCRTQHSGLFLTGNSYRGISLNDCVVDAARVAAAVEATP